MKYYVLRIEWSQTDQDTVIVRATSKEAAIAVYKYEHGPRYVTCIGVADSIKDA